MLLPGSVAGVISQDGGVRFVCQKGGCVTYWERVNRSSSIAGVFTRSCCSVVSKGPGWSSGPFYFFCYLQDFLKWRDPDSNRGHHDFQICPEIYV